jgi:hypothetical protein
MATSTRSPISSRNWIKKTVSAISPLKTDGCAFFSFFCFSVKRGVSFFSYYFFWGIFIFFVLIRTADRICNLYSTGQWALGPWILDPGDQLTLIRVSYFEQEVRGLEASPRARKSFMES